MILRLAPADEARGGAAGLVELPGLAFDPAVESFDLLAQLPYVDPRELIGLVKDILICSEFDQKV